jgi:hypothetical protein
MPTVFPATLINKGGTDKTVILAVRTQMIYPFTATGWTDLRVGFLLSLTQTGADDTITGLGETITNGAAGLFPQDRYWIGIKNRNTIMPKNGDTWFIGFSNFSWQSNPHELVGNSVLSSSDLSIGAGANYWRPNNSYDPVISGGILAGSSVRAVATSEQIHFPQVVGGGGAPGYATLLVLRIQRSTPTDQILTVTTKVGTNSADVLFTSTPTLDLLRTNLESFPTTVQQWGPAFVGTPPDALYCYWPFASSRLRIHALGVLKFA